MKCHDRKRAYHTACVFILNILQPEMKKQSPKRKRAVSSKTASVQNQEKPTVSNANANPFWKSPLFDLLRVFEKAPDQWAARYILILTAIILRSAVGLGPFSGKGEKPINGDFEAQRHWMEITTHLPINEWYFYDLQYWGLDYPPLTAYHLWIFGKIGSFINSDWFAFVSSRGIESDGIKTFMRQSSLISDLVLFFPAVFHLTSILSKSMKLGRMHQIVVLTLIITQPSLILIDHGHFQYNSVMLGFFLFSVAELLNGNLMLASIWFMSSVLFKQMALYYSPFIFFFIFSKLFTPSKTFSKTLASFKFGKLIVVGLSVLLTTTVSVLPFILSSRTPSEAVELVKQILIRMFPFERGLFEDKVANFWCTSNLVIKYNTMFTNGQLKNLSLALTLLFALPPCLLCFSKNVVRHSIPPIHVLYGFSACAWAFYLFLFQVHEKTVLVPLIPSTFLLLTQNRDIISIVQWINNISTFSLYPLLKKDGLVLQYTVTLLLINWLIGGFVLPRKENLLWPSTLPMILKLIVSLSYVAVLGFHIVDASVTPPLRYPDLWVIANTTISFGCFATFYVWLLYKVYYL